MNLEPLVQELQQLEQYPPSWGRLPEREACFGAIAHFLETHIRPGQPFDLKSVQPNPLWMLLEDRLAAALSSWTAEPSRRTTPVCVRQWYSSSVIIDMEGKRLGFDVIPYLRIYDWPDRYDLTGQLADGLDALLITHRHQDHYDPDLVRACLEREVPVYLPESVALQWKAHPFLFPVVDGHEWDIGPLHCSARVGPHVWRETVEELPVCIYSCAVAGDPAIVYGGDADYTRLPDLNLDVPVRAYFLPWRAPNACYESGHERQIGTLQEAFDVMLQQVDPATVFYEHCAELEHVHDGFSASFDMALDLKCHSPVPSELLFWGESIALPDAANQS